MLFSTLTERLSKPLTAQSSEADLSVCQTTLSPAKQLEEQDVLPPFTLTCYSISSEKNNKRTRTRRRKRSKRRSRERKESVFQEEHEGLRYTSIPLSEESGLNCSIRGNTAAYSGERCQGASKWLLMIVIMSSFPELFKRSTKIPRFWMFQTFLYPKKWRKHSPSTFNKYVSTADKDSSNINISCYFQVKKRRAKINQSIA